jgi:RNA polymerase sigma-70 factor (ECF subfamily)
MRDWYDGADRRIRRFPNSIMTMEGKTSHNRQLTSASTDALLIRCVCEGDRQAMADIFDCYSEMVYAVALRVLKDTSRAEDVMQEIFFQLWKKPESFASGKGSLGGWLAVVARNRAIDALRQRRNSESPDNVVLPSQTNLASETERNLLIEAVRRQWTNLPPEQQNSLELAYFEGLTHSEIAERTGDPLGTVKTRIRSALVGLRKALAR